MYTNVPSHHENLVDLLRVNYAKFPRPRSQVVMVPSSMSKAAAFRRRRRRHRSRHSCARRHARRCLDHRGAAHRFSHSKFLKACSPPRPPGMRPQDDHMALMCPDYRCHSSTARADSRAEQTAARSYRRWTARRQQQGEDRRAPSYKFIILNSINTAVVGGSVDE